MHDSVSPEELARWRRWFAVECNNRAWKLAESPSRTPDEDEEMLHSAHASALHWDEVGTQVNHMRAAMLLGHVHGLLGDGRRAMRYAREAYDFVMGRESPAWEVAFAHAVLANAAHAAGDRALHGRHYEMAHAEGTALPDAEERAIFEAMFRAVPAPG